MKHKPDRGVAHLYIWNHLPSDGGGTSVVYLDDSGEYAARSDFMFGRYCGGFAPFGIKEPARWAAEAAEYHMKKSGTTIEVHFCPPPKCNIEEDEQ